MNGTIPEFIVRVVEGDVRVELRLVLTSGQISLYPMMAPFWSISGGAIHCSVVLVEKKVELIQLMGGAAGAEERSIQFMIKY